MKSRIPEFRILQREETNFEVQGLFRLFWILPTWCFCSHGHFTTLEAARDRVMKLLRDYDQAQGLPKVVEDSSSLLLKFWNSPDL